MIITIDGPAGTGKTTIARRIAEKLKFAYFDTGAMYRALTYQILTRNIDINNSIDFQQILNQFTFDIRLSQDAEKRYFVAGEDVTEKIRSREVTQKVSEISTHPEVRKTLGAIQRGFGKGKNAIFEGRDMGTVVFPDAELKIFLTARPAVRAERRYKELQNKQASPTPEQVLEELLARDHTDSTREIAPLKPAADAHIIDTSDLNIEQVITQILALVPHG